MKKTIAIDCRVIFTGVGRYVRELISRLPEVASDIDFVVYTLKGYSKDIPKGKNITTKETDIQIFSLGEQTKWLKELNSHNYDLVHFTQYNAPIFYKKKYVMTIHDLIPLVFRGRKHSYFKWLVFKKLLKHNVKKAEHIFCVSNYTESELKKYIGKNINITVTWLGKPEAENISNQQKIEIKKKYNLPEKYFLYMGNHRIHKNLPNLIKAFHIVSRTLPEWKLVISGKNDPLYPEVFEEVNRISLSDSDFRKKVIFLGLVPWEDTIPIIAGSTVYVFPSLMEGFGLPILEAMSMGIPVLSSNTTSLPEVGGDAVLYFDPTDPDLIASTMQKITEDKNLYQSLVQKGFKRIENFSWDEMAKKTVDIYRQYL